MGHSHIHRTINTRSFVVSQKFLRSVGYSYIFVLIFNVIYSTIFDFDDVKLNMEAGDISAAESGLQTTITCVTKEFRILAVTSAVNVKSPQTWLWRTVVAFGSGMSLFLVPLFVENKKLVKLCYVKEISLFVITYYIDITTPVIHDSTHFGIWILHLAGVLSLGIANVMMAVECKYTWHVYSFTICGVGCVLSLAISRLACIDYFYSLFIILEYTSILQIIFLQIKFLEEYVCCVKTSERLEYLKMRRPEFEEKQSLLNENFDKNFDKNLDENQNFSTSNPDLKKRGVM